MSKTARFFAICGAVCAVGIIMTAAGFAMGGVQDIEKVEDSHSWFNVGPMNSETEAIAETDYDSIRAEGNMDLALVGSGFAGDMASDFGEDWIENAYNTDVAGNVMIRWQEGTEKPEVKVEEGVLLIHCSEAEPSVEVNLSAEDSCPDVVVFCDKNKLKDVEVHAGYGDIAAGGFSCDHLKIVSGAGDLAANDVSCADLSIEVKTGDIELANCEGKIEAKAETGDIEFDTGLPMENFTVSLHTDTGDVKVNGENAEDGDFSADGSPNELLLRTRTGDVEADFQRQE